VPLEFDEVFLKGVIMDSVVKASAEAVSAAANNLIINVVAVMCGLGLVVFACMATSGLDMSAGFF
jgi:hypothetical protein